LFETVKREEKIGWMREQIREVAATGDGDSESSLIQVEQSEDEY
jgi:hypothetical protein